MVYRIVDTINLDTSCHVHIGQYQSHSIALLKHYEYHSYMKLRDRLVIFKNLCPHNIDNVTHLKQK